jgi:hypothetical protein
MIYSSASSRLGSAADGEFSPDRDFNAVPFAGALTSLRLIFGSVISSPVSGGSVTELSVTDAWHRAAAGDGDQRFGTDKVRASRPTAISKGNQYFT